ncbi:lysoplasmalogenase [Vibrio tubiashii]|uniref:Lysoplasmalogenase n=1 Tax=Vibrio tubiashii TaxID=29498 RepID=A0AAE5LJV7_9VIBR|nr:lysoplasmalogenase [Vibrio tubiashii]NOI83092.1 lysoplasmalogenase [Vibrio tubiashii]
MWLLITLTCAIHVWSINQSNRWIFYLSKPTPIFLMSVIVFGSQHAQSTYALWIGVGLILSCIGDIFLMHPKDKFIQGLSVFLLAHFAYSIAFFSAVDMQTNVWILLTLLAIGTLVYLLLLPNLGRWKLPIAVYSLGILMMAWGTIEHWNSSLGSGAGYAVLGAFIFIVSDVVLAVDRFRSHSAYSRHVVMITYYTAQTLLTLSVVAS